MKTAVNEAASANLVAPVLREVVSRRSPDWIDILLESLDRDSTVVTAASIILELPDPDSRLLTGCLRRLPEMLQLVETECMRGLVPVVTLLRLLSHDDVTLACTAAIGTWLSEPKGSVGAPLMESWRQVIVRYGRSSRSVDNAMEHWLGEIVRADGDLALEWLLARSYLSQVPWLIDLAAVDKLALSALDTASRLEFLRSLPDAAARSSLVRALVGDNLGVFRELLSRPSLRQVHLAPLGGIPIGAWAQKASVALAAGFSVQDIAGAPYKHQAMFGRWGNESAMWQTWVDAFEDITSDADARIARIGEIGAGLMAERRNRALAEERNEDVFGR